MNKSAGGPTPRSILSKELLDKSLRLVLSSIPMFPGPEMFDVLVAMRKSRSELADKVGRAAGALSEASQLVDELEETLKERSTQMEKIRLEYERLSNLAEIEEGKAAALIQQVQLTLNQGKAVERWVSLGLSLFAGVVVFIIGVVVGPWLTKAIGIGQP